jgi:hypothetical protein
MAKFGRYDPRNKKKDRNKKHSLNKDNRIRETEQLERSQQVLLREVQFEDEYIDDEPQQLHS